MSTPSRKTGDSQSIRHQSPALPLKKLERKKNINCANKHDKTTHVAKKRRFERLDVSYVTTYIFRSES